MIKSEDNWGLLQPQIVSQINRLKINTKSRAVEHLKKFTQNQTPIFGEHHQTN